MKAKARKARKRNTLTDVVLSAVRESKKQSVTSAEVLRLVLQERPEAKEHSVRALLTMLVQRGLIAVTTEYDAAINKPRLMYSTVENASSADAIGSPVASVPPIAAVPEAKKAPKSSNESTVSVESAHGQPIHIHIHVELHIHGAQQ